MGSGLQHVLDGYLNCDQPLSLTGASSWCRIHLEPLAGFSQNLAHRPPGGGKATAIKHVSMLGLFFVLDGAVKRKRKAGDFFG